MLVSASSLGPCLVLLFPRQPPFRLPHPSKSSFSSKIFTSLVMVCRMKSELLSMTLQVRSLHPAWPSGLVLCHPLAPRRSGAIPDAPHPCRSSCLSSHSSAWKPLLDLCKSRIHPSGLSSNVSSLRFNVAFCQFSSFFEIIVTVR